MIRLGPISALFSGFREKEEEEEEEEVAAAPAAEEDNAEAETTIVPFAVGAPVPKREATTGATGAVPLMGAMVTIEGVSSIVCTRTLSDFGPLTPSTFTAYTRNRNDLPASSLLIVPSPAVVFRTST